MDINNENIEKEKSLKHFKNIEDKIEKKDVIKKEKEKISNQDNIGFDKFFILSEEEDKYFSPNLNSKESENDNQKNINKEEELGYKISIDLTDINNKKLHNYLNEDLIDAMDKSIDEPINNQYISDLSHNENDTNYSQNNISNDNDIYNNYSNIKNNFKFYPQQLNSIHNTISFFPKGNKKKQKENKEENNNKNNNNINLNNENTEEKKSIKKLVDYFGNSNPLDAPVYIPQKFKSLKFNQKPNKINDNEIYNKNIRNIENNNNDLEKKEEKSKKPFEIREGDWTCEFCFNLNFAFRTKCNRCGLIKDWIQIKNNSLNNNDNFQNYQNIVQTNLYLGNNPNSIQYLNNNNNFTTNLIFSPNTNYL